MRGHLLLAALLGLALPAAAQVRQSGTVTPGHVATWTTTGVVQDGGTAATPVAGSFGLLGTGTPFCIADSAVSGPYHQLCFGANSSGGGVLSYNAVGGATTLPFNFLINGVTSPFSSLVFASMANNTVLSNISGGTAAAVGNSLTSVLDATLGSTPGSVVYRAAGGWAALGPGSNGNCLTYVSIGPAVAWGSCAGTPALRGFLGGCGMSNDGGNPNTVIDTASCQAVSDDAAVAMVLAAFTKSTGAWAVGTGNGCLDAGGVGNSTWYHMYVIERVDTGVVDQLCSTSATAPTMPANYTKKRRIGSFKTDVSSQIVAFSQNGDEFLWLLPVLDVNTSGLTTSRSLYSMSVPPGVKVNVLFSAAVAAAASVPLVYFTSPDQADVAASFATGAHLSTPAAGVDAAGQFNIRSNTSQQIGARSSNASTAFSAVTAGWVDTRGK